MSAGGGFEECVGEREGWEGELEGLELSWRVGMSAASLPNTKGRVGQTERKHV